MYAQPLNVEVHSLRSRCCIRLCKHAKHYLCRIFHKRSIKRLPCLHSLMQTREGVWENSKVFVYKLSTFSKLPLVFASGYVNTASILYLLNVNDINKLKCVKIEEKPLASTWLQSKIRLASALHWLAMTLVELKFVRNSEYVFHRLATVKPKSYQREGQPRKTEN